MCTNVNKCPVTNSVVKPGSRDVLVTGWHTLGFLKFFDWNAGTHICVCVCVCVHFWGIGNNPRKFTYNKFDRYLIFFHKFKKITYK